MLGHRSCHPELVSLDPEIERTLRGLRTNNRISKVLGTPSNSNMAGEEDIKPQLQTHFIPSAYTSPSCIRLPDVADGQYEIRPATLQMLPSFYGLANEDPYKHLDEFHEMCTTVKLQNLTDNALRLRLFPFSLKDRAKHWLNSLKAESITTWDQLQ